MIDKTEYTKRIQGRSHFRFILGLWPRGKSYLINSYIVWIARKKGAKIGSIVTMPYKLAKNANKNLVVGNNTSIQTNLIDLRASVKIGNNVIIGKDVEIITCSHNVDSAEWEHKEYGIEIDNFSWLATGVLILPSCQKIGKGSVCGAGSVVVKNVDSMSIVAGNPAKHLRQRQHVHLNLVIESLLGNDLVKYIKTYKGKIKNE